MKPSIPLQPATPADAEAIAPLIMEAMNLECCQNWAGPDHSLGDFRQLMERLIRADESQYSHRNTTVARADGSTVAGICVCYDGGRLHCLRQAFIAGAREAFGIDYSHIDDETEAGEYYIDSLAVAAPYRGQGIAKQLLRHAIEQARSMNLPRVGLLVDADNPKAERLYTAVGFAFAGNTAWGGHAMRHLVYEINAAR